MACRDSGVLWLVVEVGKRRWNEQTTGCKGTAGREHEGQTWKATPCSCQFWQPSVSQIASLVDALALHPTTLLKGREKSKQQQQQQQQ
jgi:hypothetical protein